MNRENVRAFCLAPSYPRELRNYYAGSWVRGWGRVGGEICGSWSWINGFALGNGGGGDGPRSGGARRTLARRVRRVRLVALIVLIEAFKLKQHRRRGTACTAASRRVASRRFAPLSEPSSASTRFTIYSLSLSLSCSFSFSPGSRHSSQIQMRLGSPRITTYRQTRNHILIQRNRYTYTYPRARCSKREEKATP